jgi:amidophosphoribosyltransferase
MSTVGELFAPQFMAGRTITPEEEQSMAEAIGATSLRYLPVEALEACVGLPSSSLCQACVNTIYPTPAGERMYARALERAERERESCGSRPGAPPVPRERVYV